MWWTLCISSASYHNWTPYDGVISPSYQFPSLYSILEVKLPNLINLPPLKLSGEGWSRTSLLGHTTDVGHPEAEPLPTACPPPRSAYNKLLGRSNCTFQSLCRHGNSSPEGKTDHKSACLICPLTARFQGHVLAFSTAVALPVILMDWHQCQLEHFCSLTLTISLCLIFWCWQSGQANHEHTWTNKVDTHKYITTQLLLRYETFLWSVFLCQISLRYSYPVRGIRIFVISL